MAYEINCPVFKPFEWLTGDDNESAWPMLEDYCDDDEYYEQDAILRGLYDNDWSNLPEELEEKTKEELIQKYKDEAPITIANAMKKMAMHDLLTDRGYRYGSGWLGIPLPADIEKQINDICQQIEEEEDELTESLVPVFNMGADDFEATDEIVQKVMELRECDEEEAKRFIALGMHLGCTFGDLNDTFEEDDADKCRYNANGIEYYIGTDDELEAIADDYIHNDGDYEYFWREAVAAQKTTDSLEDWLDEVLRMDGWASILNHWNGSSDSYMVAGECIEVCRT